MKGYTKADHMRAIGTMLSEDSSMEEKKAAGDIAMAYQDQLDQDCKVCRYYWDHSTSEEGEHNLSCPHHPKRYGEAANRVRCIVCGTSTTLSDVSALGATVWHSRGNYGSKFVDRMGDDPGTLRIEVCDLCLLTHRHRVIDSASGKWETWEPFVPPEVKGEVIRIHQDEKGHFVARTTMAGGGASIDAADTVAELLERLTKHEHYMVDKGFPLKAREYAGDGDAED